MTDDQPDQVGIEDAEARMLEHGDFMAMRARQSDGEVLYEPLPGRIELEGGGVFFYFGEEVYMMRIDDLNRTLERGGS